jgi:hypothetical protein
MCFRKRFCFLFLLLFTPIFLFAQNNIIANADTIEIKSQIRDLNKQKALLLEKLNNVKFSIDSLEIVLNKIEVAKIISESFYLVTLSEAKFRDNPNPEGNIISITPTEDSVLVLGYTNAYYRVSYKDRIGYMNEMYLKNGEDNNYRKRIIEGKAKKESENSNEYSGYIENSSGRIVEAHQCVATTQAGSQCKRSAKEGSSFCWQHEPSYSPSSSNTIYTGPRGGKYYINKNGNKTYIRKKK